MQSVTLSTLFLGLVSLGAAHGTAPGDPGNGVGASAAQRLATPVAAEMMRDTLTIALFGRVARADDVAFELMATPLPLKRAVAGWSSTQEVFDFVPTEYTKVRSEPGGLFADAAPEIHAALDAPGAELGLTTGVLSSPAGAVVIYGATIVFEHPTNGRVRYLVPLAAFSARDSAEVVIPSLIEQGQLDVGSSIFLPRAQVAGSGTGGVQAFGSKPTAVSCVLKTAACVAGLTLLALGCIGACATLTPACIACVIGAHVTAAVCCSACHCWAARGVSISCGC